jgi:hypothetical protein
MALLRLVTFPVSGPLSGGKWLLKTLLDEAERRYYDEESIRNELAEVQRQFLAGQITEPQMERKEEQMLQRLIEARAHQRQRRTMTE